VGISPDCTVRNGFLPLEIRYQLDKLSMGLDVFHGLAVSGRQSTDDLGFSLMNFAWQIKEC
jgi:hypothetical protein